MSNWNWSNFDPKVTDLIVLSCYGLPLQLSWDRIWPKKWEKKLGGHPILAPQKTSFKDWPNYDFLWLPFLEALEVGLSVTQSVSHFWPPTLVYFLVNLLLAQGIF